IAKDICTASETPYRTNPQAGFDNMRLPMPRRYRAMGSVSMNGLERCCPGTGQARRGPMLRVTRNGEPSAIECVVVITHPIAQPSSDKKRRSPRIHPWANESIVLPARNQP
ncbi:MAG TPA: hypothetical protein VF184_00065, partial [Phycisphaeraceae bacterium]